MHTQPVNNCQTKWTPFTPTLMNLTHGLQIVRSFKEASKPYVLLLVSMCLQICSVTFKGLTLKANEEPNDVSSQRT